MSDFGKLAAKALRGVRKSLGTNGSDELSIASGEKWLVTRAELRTGRDYEVGGQQINATQSAVGETSEFEDRYSGTNESYLGKTVTVGGVTLRIADISRGEVFTEIMLGSEEEGL